MIAATAGRVLITSLRGGAATIFAPDGTPVATHHCADLCGTAATAGGFMLTHSLGATWAADDVSLTRLSADKTQWEYCLVSLQAGARCGPGLL